jgi:hypothetical protein
MSELLFDFRLPGSAGKVGFCQAETSAQALWLYREVRMELGKSRRPGLKVLHAFVVVLRPPMEGWT